MQQQPQGQNPYTPPQQGHQAHGAPAAGHWAASQYDPREVAARISKLNNTSFIFGVPGLLLQGVGNMTGGIAGVLASLAGTILLIVGLSFYARSRGQHPAYALLGLLSLLGLIILAVLPKKCVVCGGPSARGACTQCGAPVAK